MSVWVAEGWEVKEGVKDEVGRGAGVVAGEQEVRRQERRRKMTRGKTGK